MFLTGKEKKHSIMIPPIFMPVSIMTRMHVGFLSMALVLLLLAASFAGCTGQQTTPAPATAAATAAPTAAPTPAAPQKEILWVSIARLRQKLEKDAHNPKHIVTRSGLGYLMPPLES